MIHYSADGTLAVVHGLLPVGRRMIAARLVLVEARHCCRRRLLLRDALPGLYRTPPQILRLRRVHGLVETGLDNHFHIDVGRFKPPHLSLRFGRASCASRYLTTSARPSDDATCNGVLRS